MIFQINTKSIKNTKNTKKGKKANKPTKSLKQNKQKMYYKQKSSRVLPQVPIQEHKIKVDYAKLLDILSVRRYSKSEVQNKFVDDLFTYFTKKGVIVEVDEYGNLYITKGKADLYRCAVAHVDINQAERDRVRVYKNENWIFGFDLEQGEQCGIGADDSVGVYFAIEMFNHFDNFKIFFAKDEEIGCIGSNRADTSFFSDCSMIIQLDRRSYTTDLITYTNGIKVCSPEFVEAASAIMDKYGYKENNGIATDIYSPL